MLNECVLYSKSSSRVVFQFSFQKFAAGKQLDGYERKKCVWKLVYISMLGYDIPFGQIEALNSISSTKYSEKAAGYIASALLLPDNAEILGLSINLIKVDLHSTNDAVAALAFNFLANVGTEQMCEVLFNDVQQAANMAPGSRSYIRQKAYLAMLRFVRLRPETLPPNVWASRISQSLQSENDIGCLTSLASLILGVLELHETGWQSVFSPVVHLLSRYNINCCSILASMLCLFCTGYPLGMLHRLQCIMGLLHLGSKSSCSEFFSFFPLRVPNPSKTISLVESSPSSWLSLQFNGKDFGSGLQNCLSIAYTSTTFPRPSP